MTNRFAVFIGAGWVFCLVVWPWESWKIFVVDGEVLRLFTGRLGYHANWENVNQNLIYETNNSSTTQYKK